MRLREWTFGWTIEAQVMAARLDAAMTAVPVRERRRLAGQQKVSKVSWRRSLFIGWQIALAGWRAKRRALLPIEYGAAVDTVGGDAPSLLSKPAGARGDYSLPYDHS